MNNSYVYKTYQKVEVPVVRNTEPASSALFFARKIRFQREKDFKRYRLRPGDKKIEAYLASLAREINCRAEALQFEIMEQGKLFCEAKELVRHGEFNSWVEQNTEYSKQTALNFMHVYKACLGYPEIVGFYKPSELYTICAPSFPKDFQKALFEKSIAERRVNDIGRKELIEVMQGMKEGKMKLEDPEVQEMLRSENERDYFYIYKARLEALEALLEVNRQEFQSLEQKYIFSPTEEKKNWRDFKFYKVTQMVEGFIAATKLMCSEINPDLNKKHKNCVNKTVLYSPRDMAEREQNKRLRPKIRAAQDRELEEIKKEDEQRSVVDFEQGKVKRVRMSKATP